MYKVRSGYTIPEQDTCCFDTIFQRRDDVYTCYPFCRDFNVVVQAGGNFGIWPLQLAEKFGTVYTFEPDPVNFACLVKNTGDVLNIIKFQAALGKEPGCIDLARNMDNPGAHFIEGKGLYPTLRIDDLALPACDLICLDIEGFELFALQGAEETIKKYRPVILLEENGLCEKYGTPSGTTQQYLEYIGYKLVARAHRDIILVPGELC